MEPDLARRLLDAERARLEEIRDAAGRHLEAAATSAQAELSLVDPHPTDAASDLEERETHQATDELVEADLREVDAALARLEAGGYGICEACGKAIGDARLEALPTARLCIEDQARVEQQRA